MVHASTGIGYPLFGNRPRGEGLVTVIRGRLDKIDQIDYRTLASDKNQ